MDASAVYPVSNSHSRTNERQGLCHISQLLEMLFVKYGISTDESEEFAVTDSRDSRAVTNSSESVPFPVAVESSEVPASTTFPLTACPKEAQSTFAWFQSNELTI